MKKFLLVLTVFALFVTSAFAAVTTVTKENSEAGYPGVLTKGSVTGTGIFISDLSALSNIALIEYNTNTAVASGLVVVKTDMGIMGLSIGKIVDPIVTGIAGNNLDTFGLMYGTTMHSINLGAKLTVGINNSDYENKDLVNNIGGLTGSGGTIDKQNTSNSFLGIKLGASLKNGIDLSLGVAMNNTFSNAKNYNNVANGSVTADTTADQGKLGFDLSGRMGIGNGFTTVLGVIINTATIVNKVIMYNNTGTKLFDSTSTVSNFYAQVNALIGKDIKATDSLTFKVASGVSLYMDQSPKTVTKNNMPGGLTSYATGTKWSELQVNIPLNVAVEGKLNDTWGVNAGVSATLVTLGGRNTKNNTNAATENLKDYFSQGWVSLNPALNYQIGVTGKIGDLTLDCWINPAIPLNGTSFISGIALGYGWK